MDTILPMLKALIEGKQTDTKKLAEEIKKILSKGYFELRKKHSVEQVNALQEIQKGLATWEANDSQRAYLEHFYNVISNEKSSIYKSVTLKTSDPTPFRDIVTTLIGAGIPGSELDNFENWLADESVSKGDGYRFMTPTKNAYGMIVIIEENPRTWQVSFYGTKQVIGDIAHALGQ